jgi:hypothetical protein
MKTTAINEAATLMELAVVGLYPKTFETTVIMNGYPRKWPEEVSGILQEVQFPTAQTVVRKWDVAGSDCGVLEVK